MQCSCRDESSQIGSNDSINRPGHRLRVMAISAATIVRMLPRNCSAATSGAAAPCQSSRPPSSPGLILLPRMPLRNFPEPPYEFAQKICRNRGVSRFAKRVAAGGHQAGIGSVVQPAPARPPCACPASALHGSRLPSALASPYAELPSVLAMASKPAAGACVAP